VAILKARRDTEYENEPLQACTANRPRSSLCSHTQSARLDSLDIDRWQHAVRALLQHLEQQARILRESMTVWCALSAGFQVWADVEHGQRATAAQRCRSVSRNAARDSLEREHARGHHGRLRRTAHFAMRIDHADWSCGWDMQNAVGLESAIWSQSHTSTRFAAELASRILVASTPGASEGATPRLDQSSRNALNVAFEVPMPHHTDPFRSGSVPCGMHSHWPVQSNGHASIP
jgi:hypothetical protein